jgi:hypothetical protein
MTQDDSRDILRAQDDFRYVLCPHLERLFAPLGFTLQDSGLGLVRQTGAVIQSIGIPVSVYPPEAHFSLLFGFRIEAAEELYHWFSGVEPEYQPESETCVVTIEAIAPDVPKRGILVSDERPLPDALAWLAPILTRDVFPFLEAHRTLESLHELLSGDRQLRLVGTMQPDPAMHAVILAYLRQTADWLRFAASYRSDLVGKIDEEDLAGYDQLVEYLRQR